MKRILTAALALSLLSGASAFAQPRHDDHRPGPPGPPPRGGPPAPHHWGRGERLPANYRARSYRVADWRAHHLRAPPRGYYWQRVDDNYVLAAAATGLIAEVIAASR